MSDSVRWKEAVFADLERPQTLEDCFRFYGASAGIHDFDFQNTIDEDFSSFAAWTGDALATWDVSGNTLSATGGGASIWYEARHSTQVPPSFVASFDLVSGVGGFVFHGRTNASTADCYMAYWNAANYGFARVNGAKAATAFLVMPYTIAAPARIQVAVKWKLDSVDDSRKWLIMSLYVDGQEYATFADDIGGTAYDWDEDYVGFTVTESTNLVVDNFTVQELKQIVDYAAIDPGESPGQGLARAVGTTRVKMLGRYDGTMRIWKPANRSSDWSVAASRPVRLADREDRIAALTHVRAIGVTNAVDRFDDGEGDAHMHRFVQVDDPNIMGEEEIYAEAGHHIADSKEQQSTAQLQMPLQPLTEPWDVITYDGTDYRVVSVNHALTSGPSGVARPVTVLDTRKYVAR